MFLTADELADLTGYKQARKQIDILRRQGVSFFLNAAGHPKVPRTAIEGGRQEPPKQKATWTPSWAGNHP